MTLLNGINQLLLFIFLLMGIAALSWHLTEKTLNFFRKRRVKQNEAANRQTLQSHLTQMPIITQAPMQIPYYQQQAPPPQAPQMMYDPAPPPPQGYYYEQPHPHAYEEQAQMQRPPMLAFHATEPANSEDEYDETKKGNKYRDFVARNFK